MLYKYLPANRLQVLEKLEIRFTQQRALNDPFEALPLIDTSSEIKDFIDEIERGALDLWEKTSPEEKTPENYQKLQDTVRDLKADVPSKVSPDCVGFELMDKINEAIGVLSLSRTFNNLLMWSHYADSHKGFVIGLDESHEFFHQITFQGIRSFPNKVSYTTQRSIVHVDDPDFYGKVLCEKPIDWAYEEEVRIFRVFTEHTKKCCVDTAGYPVYLIDLPKECIKSIYLGADSKPGLKERILRFTKLHNLCADIYETKISKIRYELEYQKIV